MTDSDPIFDLDRCAQALAHGHDPAEIAVHLQGVIERLRKVRSAKDERRDVLAFIDARFKFYSTIEESHAEGRDWRGADRANAMASAARYISACLRSADHVKTG